MQLSVTERLLLLNMLPTTGDLATLREVQKLHTDLDFIETERARLKLVVEGNTVRWDKSQDTPIEVELTPKRRTMIQQAFEHLDQSEKLTLNHVQLLDRITLGITLEHPFPKEA